MSSLSMIAGFQPIEYLNGQKYDGAHRKYYKNTANSGIIAVGDPVIIIASSTSPDGYPEIARATTGGAVTGVVVGIYPFPSDLSKHGCLLAADTGYIMVADDPELIHQVQEAGSGSALTIASIGLCINSCAAINANTTTQLSNYTIDNNALSSGNTWRLEGLITTPDNTLGGGNLSASYRQWKVSANLHTNLGASAAIRTNI
jgi:hypothetical protein